MSCSCGRIYARSAILWGYERAKQKLPNDCDVAISQFIKGYERNYTEAKARGEAPMKEGKMPMSFVGYEWLAKKAVGATTDFAASIFAWSYLTLCWNLMARSDSIQTLLFEHLSWENDSFLTNFIKVKNDQLGTRQYPRKIYANPVKPHICPVLALAVYIFTLGARCDGTTLLWGNNNGASRFSKWLKSTMTIAAGILRDMCILVADIGTHSFRKGIASWLSGMVGGPSPINIYLRAGWSLGNQSRYILSGFGGDELTGRAATGLNINLPEFASLPPHYNTHEGPIFSELEWEEVFPGYSNVPPTFRQALPFLLASIYYHWDWLNSNLHAEHPLRTSRVWTHPRAEELRGKVHVGEFVNKTTGLNASGIRLCTCIH
jgi:hypothetical protein